MGENLMDALLNEIERVSAIRQIYLDLPLNAGTLGAMLMKQHIDQAKKAIGEMDVVGMVRAYRELQQVQE